MELPSEGELLADKYRIGAMLGSGGFGRVVRAEDVVTGRPVAVKILKPTAASLTTSQRFLREMRAIAQLESPHTLTLFDYGRTPTGLLYMVTELVDGYDLSELLVRRQRLSPGDTVHILLQILYSLREAHQQGLIHRDIKPANIRLFRLNDDPHRVKVLDFGLARSFEDDNARVTQTGHVVGTLRYMSPEQLNGLPQTPATDVYSAGLVALEMLEGRAVMLEKLDAFEPIRITRTQRVPEELAVVIDRMLEWDSERRYPDAGAVVRDLRRLRRTFSLPAPAQLAPAPAQLAPAPARVAPLHRPGVPAPPVQRAPRSSHRLAASVLLTSIVGLACVVLLWTSTKPEPAVTPRLPAREVPVTLFGESGTPPDAGPSSRLEARSGSPTCAGQPPPFFGVGKVRRQGPVGGRHAAFVPDDYNGRRKFGLLLHHVGTGLWVGGLRSTTTHTPSRTESRLVRAIGDELDLVVLEVRLDLTDQTALDDAIDAAAESLCIDASRVWVVSTLDVAKLDPLWCARPVLGLVSISPSGSRAPTPSSGAAKTSRHCPIARFHLHHPRYKASRGAIDDAASKWRAQLNGARCENKVRTTTRLATLECRSWDCARPTEYCRNQAPYPDKPEAFAKPKFRWSSTYVLAIVEFVRRAEESR